MITAEIAHYIAFRADSNPLNEIVSRAVKGHFHAHLHYSANEVQQHMKLKDLLSLKEAGFGVQELPASRTEIEVYSTLEVRW